MYAHCPRMLNNLMSSWEKYSIIHFEKCTSSKKFLSNGIWLRGHSSTSGSFMSSCRAAADGSQGGYLEVYYSIWYSKFRTILSLSLSLKLNTMCTHNPSGSNANKNYLNWHGLYVYKNIQSMLLFAYTVRMRTGISIHWNVRRFVFYSFQIRINWIGIGCMCVRAKLKQLVVVFVWMRKNLGGINIMICNRFRFQQNKNYCLFLIFSVFSSF